MSALLLLVVGCFPWSGGEHQLDGPYTLEATDLPDQMALDYSLGNNAHVERVPATVFAAGWDARFVIVKRHPRDDRSRTEFYILDRSKDGPLVDPKESVVGPLTAAEFGVRRQQLGVDPALAFQVTLSNLE